MFPAGRSFYYDCLDIRSPDREAASRSRLNNVREAHGCHIPLGAIKGEGAKERQKKIDTMMAVDMLTHAAYKNMTRVILLSGDLDFQPAIESLVHLGIFVELIADWRYTAEELTWAASAYKPLTFFDYYLWSTEAIRMKYPLPHDGDYIPDLKGSPVLKTGSLDGYACTLHEYDGRYYLCIPSYKGNRRQHFSYDNLERLELYLIKCLRSTLTWD
jgi:hypothetical protein